MPMSDGEKLAHRREVIRKWREANPDRVRESERVYRKKHRALLAERMREYRKKYPERLKATLAKNRTKNRAKHRERYRRERADVIAAYGGCCVCCGESNLCFLTIDHVNNDGAKHRGTKGEGVEYHGNGYAIYNWLRRKGYPRDGRFQVLCYNCNCSKQHDPVGHRKAHPNAALIDGLGDLTNWVSGPKRG